MSDIDLLLDSYLKTHRIKPEEIESPEESKERRTEKA